MRSTLLALPVLALVACGSSDDTATPDASGLVDASTPDTAADTGFSFPDAQLDAAPPCVDTNTTQPPKLNAASGKLVAPYDVAYTAYDLGPVPGMEGTLLGGCADKPGDPNTLLVIAGSERPEGAIWEVGVKRDACGHIVGFVGKATKGIPVPYGDANLVVTGSGNMLVPQFPVATLAQVDATQKKVDATWKLGSPFLAYAGGSWTPGHESLGGLAFVPSTIVSGTELRGVGYPLGNWVHIDIKKNVNDPKLYDYVGITKTNINLTNGPGGVAYVPAGSPGFTKPAVLVAEWLVGTPPPLTTGVRQVAAYDVDANGDPIVATRREFLAQFDRPWGAHFEASTGDYLFLQWANNPDHMIQVRGFAKPPPPPN